MKAVFKLGGAVITKKEGMKTVRRGIISSIMKTISGTCIGIVHGGGSFGHPLAKKYGLNEKKVGVKEAAEVMEAMDSLSSIVFEEARKAKIPGLLLKPRNFVVNDKGKVVEGFWEIFRKYYSSGAVPISHGDVVVDISLGFSVCSGDDVMVEMCKVLRPDLAIFLTDVSGIFEEDPKCNPNANLIEEISASELMKLGISFSDKDATGGMGKKVEAILKIVEFCPVYVLKGDNVNNLKRAILGRDFIGTKIFKDREEETGTLGARNIGRDVMRSQLLGRRDPDSQSSS